MHIEGEKLIIDPAIPEDLAVLRCMGHGLAMRRGRDFAALTYDGEFLDDRLRESYKPFSLPGEQKPLEISRREIEIALLALNEGIESEKSIPPGLIFWAIPDYVLLAEQTRPQVEDYALTVQLL